MADYETIRTRSAGEGRVGVIDEGLRAYMNRVYMTMGIGMAITGLIAWFVGTNPAMLQAIYGTGLKWVVMFAPLIVVFAFGATIHRMSPQTATLVFYGYSALMGLSLSFIFAVYTGISIAQTFFVTAIAFLALSLYGYTTKRDLSGFGTFLFMGLIGLLVASVVNIFLGSPAVQFAISVIGVLIFAGLTAYDTQAIKALYIEMAASSDEATISRMAIMGALKLYLDFLNMFMFLLQFLGNRE